MNSYQINFHHLNDDEESKRVCWFTCEAFGEFIKFLHFCKEYNVEFYIREDDENIEESDIDNCELPKYIENFNVNYGSDNCIQTIDVWLK